MEKPNGDSLQLAQKICSCEMIQYTIKIFKIALLLIN